MGCYPHRLLWKDLHPVPQVFSTFSCVAFSQLKWTDFKLTVICMTLCHEIRGKQHLCQHPHEAKKQIRQLACHQICHSRGSRGVGGRCGVGRETNPERALALKNFLLFLCLLWPQWLNGWHATETYTISVSETKIPSVCGRTMLSVPFSGK